MHPLIELINLDYPGLEPVRSAVHRNDESAALDALAEYYRTRTEPDPTVLAKPDADAVPEADRVLQREFRHAKGTGTLPNGEFDWTFNPYTDREWNWKLNNHSYWRALASAYLATGDEKYAREIAMHIRTWVTTRPPSKNDEHSWRTLEAGGRMRTSWPAALAAMKRSDAFTTDIWTLYLRSIHDHAEFLIANPKTRNWLLAESNGLLAAGILFPEFTDAQKWVRIACERFEIEMLKQVHPDGGHVEYSSSYMLGCTRHFANALDIVDRNLGPERRFSQEYRERLVAMWEHVMYMLRPDGRLPMLNDSDWTVVADQLRAAGKRYGRPDFVFAATNGAEGVPPANTSHRFPWTRRVITRLGADGTDAAAWKEDAFYGFFEAAPLGVGHLHEDLLTFELMAYGQPLTGTMGRYSYEASPFKTYFRGGPAYNTVLIDGHPQNWRRADSDHRGWVDTYVNTSGRYATGPTDLPWSSTQEQDTAYAVFDKTWADESLDGTIHERWFAFRKTGQPFWLVRDRLSCGDAVERELRTLFHLYPDAEIEVNDDTGSVVVTYPSGVGFVIAMSGADAISFDAAKGQDDPPRGWFSRAYGTVEAAWDIAAMRRTVLPAQYVFAMVPFRNGVAPNVAAEETPDGARVSIDEEETTMRLLAY